MGIVNGLNTNMSSIFLDSIIEIIQDLPFDVTAKSSDGKYLACSHRAAISMQAVSPGDVIGKTDNDFYDLSLANEIRSLDKKAIESKKLATKEKNNQITTTRLALYGQENFTLLITIKEDDEQHSSREKLKMLSEIINLLPGNIYWKNREGIYLGTNKNNINNLGFKNPEDFLGKKTHDIVNKKIADRVVADDEQVMLKNQELLYEENGIDYKGEHAVFLTKKMPLHDDNGVVNGLLGMSIDITHRKNQEVALKEANEKIEEALKNNIDFVSVASHEIRSPVGNTIAILELAKSELDKIEHFVSQETRGGLNNDSVNKIEKSINKLKEYFSVAQAEGQRSLNSLINLGDLNRLKNNGVECRFQEAHLRNLIDDAVRDNIYPANDKIKINLVFDSNIPKQGKLDYQNIYDSLRILIGNAIRFSSQDGIVEINAKWIAENEKTLLQVSVKDQGKGLTAEEIATVFYNFSDIREHSNGNPYRKQALLLPQVKLKIEASGGVIFINSKAGEGAEFVLKVPVQPIKSVDSEDYSDSDIDYHVNKLDVIPRQTILLIEDDQKTQMIEKQILNNLGHDVEVAGTGEEAIALASKKDYDIIFVDITLPGSMNGLDAMKQIRKIKGRNIYFIVITSHASEDDVAYFEQEDAALVLTKPVNERKLKEAIEAYLLTKKALEEKGEWH